MAIDALKGALPTRISGHKKGLQQAAIFRNLPPGAGSNRRSGDWQDLREPGFLDDSRVARDLEGIEVLLKLHGSAFADRPDVSHLRFTLLHLPVKPEVVIAEGHNFVAAALKDLFRIKDEFVETGRQPFENA